MVPLRSKGAGAGVDERQPASSGGGIVGQLPRIRGRTPGLPAGTSSSTAARRPCSRATAWDSLPRAATGDDPERPFRGRVGGEPGPGSTPRPRPRRSGSGVETAEAHGVGSGRCGTGTRFGRVANQRVPAGERPRIRRGDFGPGRRVRRPTSRSSPRPPPALGRGLHRARNRRRLRRRAQMYNRPSVAVGTAGGRSTSRRTSPARIPSSAPPAGTAATWR